MKTNSRRHRELTSSLFYLCGIVALTACSNNYNDIRNSQSDNLTASRKSSEDKNEDEEKKRMNKIQSQTMKTFNMKITIFLSMKRIIPHIPHPLIN